MKKVLTAVLVATLALGLTATVTAETIEDEDAETSDVTVGISPTTELDVKPDNLDYQDIEVGTDPTVVDTIDEADEEDAVPADEDGFYALEFENTGSENIELIWAEASVPEEDPFGQNSDGLYDPGNMFQIRPDGGIDGVTDVDDEDQFSFINRVEFIDSEDEAQSFIQTEDQDGDDDEVFVGRFRTGEKEFYYTVQNTDGQNTCEGGELRVANTPTTPEDLGTFDFTDENENSDSEGEDGWQTESIGSAQTDAGGDETSEQLGIATGVELDFEGEGDSVDREFDVLTHCGEDEPHVVTTTFAAEWQPGNVLDSDSDTVLVEEAGDATTHIIEASGSDALNPGQSMTVDATLEVPLGVSEGDLGSDGDGGTLTFYAATEQPDDVYEDQ